MSSLKILKSFRIPTNAQSFLLPFAQSGYPISGKEVEVRGSGSPSFPAPSAVSPPRSPVNPEPCGPLLMAHQQVLSPLFFQAKSLLLPKPRAPQSRVVLSGMATAPGFKSPRQSSSAAPFLTPPTISYTCQHSRILPALLGCHSKSALVWPHGMEPIISKLSCRPYNQGVLPPS